MCALSWGATTAHAGDRPLSWSWRKGDVTLRIHGQYRPRFELMQRRDMRAPDAANGVPHDLYFVTHRARLGVTVGLWKQLTFFVQLQDVRRWGSETDTLGDFQADGFDLHQGWLAWRPWKPLVLQVGRMELIYDNHRLIGNVGWLQQARTFDAVRVKLRFGAFRWHMTAARLSDVGDPGQERLIALSWWRWEGWAFWKPSLYYIFHYNPKNSEEMRHTIGLFSNGKAGGFSYSGEFFLQFGQIGTEAQARDILAWMGALQAAYTFRAAVRPKIRLWAEFVSGNSDDPNDKTDRSFDTLFATNHKFYGLVDMFLGLPAHTGRRGLMDLGLGFSMWPVRRLMLRFDFHYFRLMAPLNNPAGAATQELGPEFDFIVKYIILPKHFSITGGYGFVVPLADQAFAALGKGNQVEHWAFLQMNVQF